jgi:transcriptional regulator with XRE-family HTH domain
MKTYRVREWVKIELEKRGITQADLSRLSGVDPAIISRLIKLERLPEPENMVAISTALGFNPQKIFYVAGLFPDPGTRRIGEEVAAYRLSQLTDAQLEEINSYAEFIRQRDESRPEWSRSLDIIAESADDEYAARVASELNKLLPALESLASDKSEFKRLVDKFFGRYGYSRR